MQMRARLADKNSPEMRVNAEVMQEPISVDTRGCALPHLHIGNVSSRYRSHPFAFVYRLSVFVKRLQHVSTLAGILLSILNWDP